jgi:hypothetical protein
MRGGRVLKRIYCISEATDEGLYSSMGARKLQEHIIYTRQLVAHERSYLALHDAKSGVGSY